MFPSFTNYRNQMLSVEFQHFKYIFTLDQLDLLNQSQFIEFLKCFIISCSWAQNNIKLHYINFQ